MKRARLLALLSLLALSCAPRVTEPRSDVEHVAVLLVAVDGMEWNVVLPLLRRGRLPELARLMDRGSFGKLETMDPTESPVIWTSIATGKRPARHGIQHFLRTKNPPTVYTNADRTTKAFWNILTDCGRSSHTIGWWVTYPVEPVKGAMVAQANSAALIAKRGFYKGSLVPGLSGQVYPPELEAAAFAHVATADRELPARVARLTGGSSATAPADVRLALEESLWSLRADAAYEKIALDLLSRSGAPDLTAVYFGACDVVAHRFWKYARPVGILGKLWSGTLGRKLDRLMEEDRIPGAFLEQTLDQAFWSHLEPAEREGWQGLLFRSYEEVDASIGRLVRAYPPETAVIVLSDHGTRPWGHGDAPPALLIAAGPNIRDQASKPPADLLRSEIPMLGSVLDVTPTLFVLAGAPLAEDLEGRVLEEILKPAVPQRLRPPARATYDTPGWLAARRVAFAGKKLDTDPERLEQLRALGYIQ